MPQLFFMLYGIFTQKLTRTIHIACAIMILCHPSYAHIFQFRDSQLLETNQEKIPLEN